MKEKDNGFLPDSENGYQKAWRIAHGDGPTHEELDIFKRSEDVNLKDKVIATVLTIAMNIQLFPYPVHIPRFGSKNSHPSLHDLSYRELEVELTKRTRRELKRF